jgi:hypothetical protein
MSLDELRQAPRAHEFGLPHNAKLRVESRVRGEPMLEQGKHSEPSGLAWTCQGVSPLDESCDSAASLHCDICGRWFCEVHGEDEEWHSCILKACDEGGEG